MSRLYFTAPRSLPCSKAIPASSGTGSCVREGRLMGHHLHCDFAGTANREKVVGLRKVTLRERLARLILGETTTVTVIVPGDSVDQVTITNTNNLDDDRMALARAVGVTTGGDRE